MKNYIGIIQEENKQFGIIFPDFPGCVSVGDTVEEAYKNGIEALSLHINGMKEDGEDNIPEPSNFETIKQKQGDWYNLDNAVVMFIPYIEEQNKTVRINITMEQTLLNKIDSITKNRSAFLSQAAERYFKYC